LYPFLGEKDTITDTKDGGYEARNAIGVQEHAKWNRIAARHEYAWNNYYKFTIERNSYDKAISAWFWHKKIKPDHPGVIEGDLKNYFLNFSAVPVDWKAYANDEHLVVDDVFQYHELYKVYDMLRERFDIDIPEEQWKGTRLKSGIRPEGDYRQYYNDETKQLAGLIWQNEIKQFGYKF
jgi:hypothetical protein